MTNYFVKELETISRKIELNSATLSDYQRYEQILRHAGLSKEYIYSYLTKAGMNSWEDLIDARKNQAQKELLNAVVVGSLVGLGLGLLINSIIGNK